jgi:hypothetical protein
MFLGVFCHLMFWMKVPPAAIYEVLPSRKCRARNLTVVAGGWQALAVPQSHREQSNNQKSAEVNYISCGKPLPRLENDSGIAKRD